MMSNTSDTIEEIAGRVLVLTERVKEVKYITKQLAIDGALSWRHFPGTFDLRLFP